MNRLVLPLALALAAPICAEEPLPDAGRLTAMQAVFAPVDLDADLSALPPGERKALAKLVAASKVVDALYLRQAGSDNVRLLLDLAADPTPLGRARLRYFLTMKGPWDRTDHHKPFIPGVGAKPPQADFYPADATKEEVEAWQSALPAEAKDRATGFFSTVRRAGGALTAVPYSVEYHNELQAAAGLLREAAGLTGQPSLKRYLESRAKAFLDDDYFASDVAWMELDASIEPTVGPYETYEDEWLGQKAAFESFVCLRDDAETAKLQKFSSELQALEDRLPIDPRWRNPKLGALAPIRVVNELYASGDAAHGVTTAAFNLPNDERVLKQKGSKRVMLKNVQEAKFQKVLLPISGVALPAAARAKVDFDAFFTHILMHELMHGLGPHEAAGPDGKPVAARVMLKETSSALEEAKADVSGLWALQRLIDKGVVDKKLSETLHTTFLASSFRTLRFGIAESHGKGMALQVNWHLDRGGFIVNADGTFGLDMRKLPGSIEALVRELMTIQAKGDYAAAKALLTRMAVIRPPVRIVLDRLKGVPVDIEPRFVAAERLLAEHGE